MVMVLIIYALACVFILGMIAGSLFREARVKYIQLLEDRVRQNLEKEKLKALPTKALSDEFFSRQEAWDIVAKKAEKGE